MVCKYEQAFLSSQWLTFFLWRRARRESPESVLYLLQQGRVILKCATFETRTAEGLKRCLGCVDPNVSGQLCRPPVCRPVRTLKGAMCGVEDVGCASLAGGWVVQ